MNVYICFCGGEWKAVLRIIIADDEKYICSLIRALVDWKALDMEIVGEAFTGSAACNLIFQENPDIAILDIKMPGMDGLNIIHQAQAAGLKTRFLLVSGHKNFEYAHTALKYGVERYLLKPINHQELEDNLRQMREQILSDQENQLVRANMADRLARNARSNRMHFIYALLNGADLNWQDLEHLNSSYDTHFVPGEFRMLIIKPDGKTPYDIMQMDILLNTIRDFVEQNLSGMVQEFISAKLPSEICVFLNDADASRMEASIHSFFKQAQRKFYPYGTITFALSKSSPVILPTLYEQARRAVLQRLSQGLNSIIEFGSRSFKSLMLRSPSDQRAFIDAFDALNPTPVEAWLNKNRPLMLDSNSDPYDLYCDLKWLMVNLLDDRLVGKIPQESLDSLRQQHEFLLDTATTREGLIKAFEDTFYEDQNKYISCQKREGSKYIRQAKQYVQDHYAENITLEDIAATIFINPVYLSIIFKKEEGKNFSEYLTEYRIERAKEFLKNCGEYNVHQISSMVGYHDSRYFSKIFTRIVGIKPSDYRRLF